MNIFKDIETWPDGGFMGLNRLPMSDSSHIPEVRPLIRIERRADEGNTGRRRLGGNWRSEVIRPLFRRGLRYGSEGFKGDFPKGLQLRPKWSYTESRLFRS